AREGGAKAEETDYDEVRRKLGVAYQKAQQGLQTVVGTPQSVTAKIKTIMQVLRPGSFTFFAIQGTVGNADRQKSMQLMAEEVIPVLREYAKEIGLVDPFERTPGSVPLRTGVARDPVADRQALAALGFK
ncbi:MAG: hypothetical protein ACREQ3_01970, partial [Candidatus Binatia bacterium]